jgi:hypothetical protein
MRSGQVAQDANMKFNEVLKAVLDTGGKGKLSIELTIAPSKMGMGGCVVEVELNHECKLKKPELQIGKSLFFVTAEGTLTRDDPQQTAMFQQEKKEIANA